MPFAFGVAAAAPPDTAPASTSTVTTLLTRDPTATTLDNPMFGLGKGSGASGCDGLDLHDLLRSFRSDPLPRYLIPRTVRFGKRTNSLCGCLHRTDTPRYLIPGHVRKRWHPLYPYRVGSR